MKSEEYIRFRKMFLFGIVVSLVTVFGGEIPIGCVVNPETDNEIFSMILGYASLSLPQLACGVFFGGIGIPLQYYGYKAIADIIAGTETKPQINQEVLKVSFFVKWNKKCKNRKND